MDPTENVAADAGGRRRTPNRRLLIRLGVPALALVTLASAFMLLRPTPAHAAASVECANASLTTATLSATFPQPEGVTWTAGGKLGSCTDVSVGKGAKVKGGSWKASGRATGSCTAADVTGSATFTWNLADGGTATSTTGVESGTVAASSVGVSLGSIDSGKFHGASIVVAGFEPTIASILSRCPIEPNDIVGSKGTLSIIG
ncbi:hypothetical protein [Actinoallomurus iriomotensis]|uniref:Uncharacterized protein n=1 Tax=Actinoallomurus iriomotensis TaxID=478107 RepID=A0A9W6RFF5_9ACTN|nr:hypothetical protein [Actinoallomurus iriomotensis]GLY74803.1 hypothetical protein Airi01_030700 [Actinoallomurus iriomotensis]